MDQQFDATEETYALLEKDLIGNSYEELVDTLLLTALHITSGNGKVSKSFLNDTLTEVRIEIPSSAANIIIQYDRKTTAEPLNENICLSNYPEMLMCLKEETSQNQCDSEFLTEKQNELLSTTGEDCNVISEDNDCRGEIIVSSEKSLTHNEEREIFTSATLESDACEDSINSCETSRPSVIDTSASSFDASKFDYVSLAVVKSLVKIKTRDKSKSYSVCRKSFSRNSYKNKHERVDNGNKTYPCRFCGKPFKFPSNKSRHEKIHTGERPYCCSYCAKTFIQSTSKYRHERTHTGEKPYSCPLCGKSFSQLTAKNEHIRIHTGEKPYSCSICGGSFSTSGSRIRHEKIRHSK